MSSGVEMRNWFYDPLPTGATGWSMDNGNNPGTKPTASFSNGQLLIQGHATQGNSYALRAALNVPAGEYVASFYARSGSAPTFFANRLLSVLNTNWASFGTVPAAALNTRHIFRFTNPTEQRIIFAFQAPNNEACVAYERILLCTADDYERLSELAVEWFSGSTYTIGGGLSLLAVYPHHLELEVVA